MSNSEPTETTEGSFDWETWEKLFSQEIEEARAKLPKGCIVDFRLVSVERVVIDKEKRDGWKWN